MKTKPFIFLAMLFLLIPFATQAQHWETPIIKGYGKIVNYKNAGLTPNPEKEYKILFHITSKKEKEGVNLKLWKIARLINLLGSNQVPKNHVKIIAVVSGPATPLVLSNKQYIQKFDKSNPNMDLLEKLTTYGVKIEVCGQALAEHNIDPKTDLNTYVNFTLSALIDIPTHQMDGYVPMF